MKIAEQIALIINNHIDNEETAEEIADEVLEFIRSQDISDIVE